MATKIHDDCELCGGAEFITYIKRDGELHMSEKCPLCAMRSRLEQAQKRITELENTVAAADKSYQELRLYTDIVKSERDVFAKKTERYLHIAEEWRSKAAASECEKLDEKRRADKAEADRMAAVVEASDWRETSLFWKRTYETAKAELAAVVAERDSKKLAEEKKAIELLRSIIDYGEPWDENDYGYIYCHFCSEDAPKHAPDCGWQKAKEFISKIDAEEKKASS